MIIIQHRVSSIKHLKKVSNNIGIELDVRSYKKKLILSHDPFKKGKDLINLIKNLSHRITVFDIKEEGLELSVLKLIQKYKVMC